MRSYLFARILFFVFLLHYTFTVPAQKSRAVLYGSLQQGFGSIISIQVNRKPFFMIRWILPVFDGIVRNMQYDKRSNSLWMTVNDGYFLFDIKSNIFYHKKNNPLQ